jgi:hypothetical protein
LFRHSRAASKMVEGLSPECAMSCAGVEVGVGIEGGEAQVVEDYVLEAWLCFSLYDVRDDVATDSDSS